MNAREANLVSAIRGPITLITLGVLFAADHLTPYSFEQTWPVLLIVFGLLSLLGPRRAPGASRRQSPGGAAMRRRSLTGPILIILVGAAFLIYNLRPDIPLFDLLAQYWPFLLIAWGTLRLLEVLLDYFRGSCARRAASVAAK